MTVAVDHFAIALHHGRTGAEVAVELLQRLNVLGRQLKVEDFHVGLDVGVGRKVSSEG